MNFKHVAFSYLQPATVALIVAVWYFVPPLSDDNVWIMTPVRIATLLLVQALEFVNERHADWRLSMREGLTDLFYLVLYYAVIGKVVTALADDRMTAAKNALGITTSWTMHLPFVAQVAFVVFVTEFGQYWLHRLMHNSALWWTHAPHHHITQPRWYGWIFTTVESRSLHHTVGFAETRCNYANVLILIDRLFGTFRDGEARLVGQDERKRLSIREQFMFPLRPLLATRKATTPG